MRPSLLRPSRLPLPHRTRHPYYFLPHLSQPLRFASSSTPRSSSANFPQPPQNEPEPIEELSDDAEKPKIRRTRISSALPKDQEPMELPEGLDILWPTELEFSGDSSHASALPPPELLEEALNNLLVTLHPQAQHRAAHPTPLGSPVEPTLGLYCPIEGGDYVIDATVRELALRTGAEVLVLDAVQLAAGEWGHFGKAANALQLPRNPLHFPPSSSAPSPSNTRPPVVEEVDDSENSPHFLSAPQQMTLTVMAHPAMAPRTIMATTPRRTAPPSRIKVFFDTLVNLPSKRESSASSSRPRPRLVYIRDFPTLAPLAASWYPHLLSAVRQRRRGPISRPSSPISNPMTIIFGMTPPISPHTSASLSGPGNGVLGMLLNRYPSPNYNGPPIQHTRLDWGEDEASERAREKRLRERLKKWEKGDVALYEEYAKLAVGSDPDDGPDFKPDVLVVGPGSGPSGVLPALFSALPPTQGKLSDSESKPSFFRTSTLIPQVRSPTLEQSTRIARRREINELTMRMGVGSVGGCVQQERASHTLPQSSNTASLNQETHMWEAWGHTLESWSNVRKVADRALGSVMSAAATHDKLDKESLELTQIPWSVVQNAWSTHKSMSDFRKAWFKEASPHGRYPVEDEKSDQTQAVTDEVVERVKNDNELDSYEQRLLPCIVDSASMTTTFSQVHLPSHTIDSVRTIVSLPLLHPQAFQQGILKEHGMTGCLLFGPPGTGKTLVVRALAHEAGCRMMLISPSDVMDMYVGEGEKLVRAVFSLARRLSPCVIFLDEIDALFGARMSARESGGAFAHRGVITEFMQEMDGLKSSQEDRVIVIGATNRPFDLDDAVLRRLPRRLLVDLPGGKERGEILRILLRDEQLADDVDIGNLAQKTDNFSGSDLKHLCVSAALDAVKEYVRLPWSVPAVQQISGELEASQTAAHLVGPALVGVPPSNVSSSHGVEVDSASQPRTLHWRNFLKALKEITPSSSEFLGSLAELRKWNEEFGEGQKERKRQQVWGKGKFGFTNKGSDSEADILAVRLPSGTNGDSHVSINTTVVR